MASDDFNNATKANNTAAVRILVVDGGVQPRPSVSIRPSPSRTAERSGMADWWPSMSAVKQVTQRSLSFLPVGYCI